MFVSLLEGLDRKRFGVSAAYHGGGKLAATFDRSASTLSTLNLLRAWNPGTVLMLARHMREIRCDIVHSHLWTADVLVGIAAKLAGVSVRVATVHGNYFELTQETGVSRVRKRMMSRIYRCVYTLYDRVIAVSNAVCQDLASRPGFKVPLEKIAVIPNCLDHRRVDEITSVPSLRSRLGLKPHAPVVSTVANFVPIKGHRWLIRAMPVIAQHFPEATFVLYGSGEGRVATQRWVKEAGIEANVIYPDEPAASALEVLALSDVVVVPSLSEGFGMVVLEACALAKPVVASAVGGIPEILEHHQTGLLVPPGDSEALAGAILLLLKDPNLRRRLGEAGRGHVRAEFSVERMIKSTEAVYEAVLGNKGGLGRLRGLDLDEPVSRIRRC